ncbi:MAG: glycerol-3-phosphate 1-O-acyltransferase PlsY [Clostridia bacterium]|nr:glycerol-3-phosphate 1-O-acyltransferase PlsY [Clostridia bacterium]
MIPAVFTEKPWMTVLACVFSYLIGSVSTGTLVSKAANGPDLRTVGSGNPGASNVQRTMGWKYGLITFVGDILKGLLACLAGRLLTGDHMGALLAGLFAVLGHNWPLYYAFKGGKGVSTSCGVMCFCFPVPALICYALTIGLIAWKRYISLGSMFLLTLYAVLVSVTYQGEWRVFVILWSCLLAVICIARHHANIGRLIKGTENKLGGKKKQ